MSPLRLSALSLLSACLLVSCTAELKEENNRLSATLVAQEREVASLEAQNGQLRVQVDGRAIGAESPLQIAGLLQFPATLELLQCPLLRQEGRASTAGQEDADQDQAQESQGRPQRRVEPPTEAQDGGPAGS